VLLWRIATGTRHHAADDLSGTGSARNPGRWSDDGEPAVYAAPAIAMAVLETVAHLDDGGLPLNRFLVRIDVPARLWAARLTPPADTLPVAWAAVPAGRASVTFGSAWLRSLRSAIIELPSAIVPEESITVINPLHPDAKRLKATVVRPFEYRRVFRSG
jgi:RES domain-containing protein